MSGFAVSATLAAWAFPVHAEVTPSLTPEKIFLSEIDDGGFRGQMALVLKGVKTETPEHTLTVSDWGIGSTQTVSVEPSQGPGDLADERQWRLDLTFERRPETETDARYLWIEYGTQLRTALPYSILPTRTELDWSVTNPLDNWVLYKNEVLGFSITTNVVSAEGIKISSSTLQRTDKRQHLDVSDFELCKDKGCTVKATSLPANQIHTVFLKVADGFAATGQFQGALNITAQGAKTAHQLPLTVYASSWRWRLIGLGLIVAGILLAWFISVFAKGRAARLASLLPASVLRDRLQELDEDLKFACDLTNFEFPKINSALNSLRQGLSDDTITTAGFVPPDLPNPFRPMAPNESEYEVYLKRRADQLSKLTLVIVNGVDYIAGRWPSIAGKEGQALSLLQALDEADTGSDLAKVKADVEETIGKFKQLIVDAGPKRGAQAPSPDVLLERSVSLATETIEVRLAALSGVVWTIWAVVTAGVGWAALIQSNPGFGTGTDLIQAFFWGLGVQVAGQQLQQLTPASVSSAFHISVPSSK